MVIRHQNVLPREVLQSPSWWHLREEWMWWYLVPLSSWDGVRSDVGPHDLRGVFQYNLFCDSVIFYPEGTLLRFERVCNLSIWVRVNCIAKMPINVACYTSVICILVCCRFGLYYRFISPECKTGEKQWFDSNFLTLHSIKALFGQSRRPAIHSQLLGSTIPPMTWWKPHHIPSLLVFIKNLRNSLLASGLCGSFYFPLFLHSALMLPFHTRQLRNNVKIGSFVLLSSSTDSVLQNKTTYESDKLGQSL